MEPTAMGAVRVRVKLTNAIDEAMISRGVLAPHLLRECETEALVDTGALTLVLPMQVVEQLGLRIRGKQVARYANGLEETVGVTEPVLIECQGRETADEGLVVGDEVMLGQVILEKLDFLVDCKNQQLVPNPANPDYPVATIK
ncbi:aspartyl protease family protein [Scytonema sp. NUACC26]|uniref:aspartyl protease family protein n=1 Tax=Scytonema sp. NUACC26 TaxID=3140176 RepID=UPI0034DC076F